MTPPVDSIAADHQVPSGPRSTKRPPYWPLTRPLAVLGLLLLCSLLFRVYHLSSPESRLIFDEAYYVTAARVILGLPVPSSAPGFGQPAGKDPNPFHPPLGKALIAGSIAILGDNPAGWRAPSLLAGLAAVLLLYAIVRTAGGDGWLAVLAASLFAFDNLPFVHSRLSTLDMMLTAFLLLGAWFYLGRWPLAAGMAIALASLVKLTGFLGIVALVLFEAVSAGLEWRGSGRWPRSAVRRVALLLAGFVPLWIGGLWLLDLGLTTYTTPWAHLQFMLTRSAVGVSGVGPTNYESYPWQWLYNEVQMPYLRVSEHVYLHGQEVGTRDIISFRGAMNPIVIGAAPLGLGFLLWRAWRLREALSLWALAWFTGTYLVFFPLALIFHRIFYIYYFLPTFPVLPVALALMLRHGGLPRPAVWAYLAAVILGFLGYFPFRYFW